MLVGDRQRDDALYGYTIGAGDNADLKMDERDSAPFMPKGASSPARRSPLPTTRAFPGRRP